MRYYIKKINPDIIFVAHGLGFASQDTNSKQGDPRDHQVTQPPAAQEPGGPVHLWTHSPLA